MAKPAGMLFSPKAELMPSIGTPSMKIFTWRPEKPFRVTLASEPTPPVERIFTPLILSMTLDRSIVVFFSLAVSTNDTL